MLNKETEKRCCRASGVDKHRGNCSNILRKRAIEHPASALRKRPAESQLLGLYPRSEAAISRRTVLVNETYG
jgi:hypothetical protein